MMYMSQVPCPTWTSKPGESWRGGMNVRSISPPFVWIFSHLFSTLVCLMCLTCLLFLSTHWPLWTHSETVVEGARYTRDSRWQSLLAACCCCRRRCYCTALHCNTTHHTTPQHDAREHGTLVEMSRVELNLAAAASPSDKLELFHLCTTKTHRHTFEFCR